MNAQRKKSAVNKYGPQKELSKEELIELLNSDEKNYTSEEVVEILEAIAEFEPDQQNNQGKEKPNTGSNKKFEEWKVIPEYKEITDAMDKVIGRKLVGFKKDAQAPIRTTSITQERADLLNSQSENTLVRLFEAE